MWPQLCSEGLFLLLLWLGVVSDLDRLHGISSHPSLLMGGSHVSSSPGGGGPGA